MCTSESVHVCSVMHVMLHTCTYSPSLFMHWHTWIVSHSFSFFGGGDILPVCVFISRDILPPEHLMPRLFCIAPLSLPLLLCFSCPVSVLCVAQAHPILMVTCLSVALENLPGILPPSSCLWVFEPGWLRLIGGQSRQHERKLCAGATGGNMEQQCAH